MKTSDTEYDALAGMAWFNGLSEDERAHWLDIAWRRNEQIAGRARYSSEDIPSAADAWEAYKNYERCTTHEPNGGGRCLLTEDHDGKHRVD